MGHQEVLNKSLALDVLGTDSLRADLEAKALYAALKPVLGRELNMLPGSQQSCAEAKLSTV